MSTLHRTIVRPLVTEQTSAMYQARGEYVFEVAPGRDQAGDPAGDRAVFGVKVTGVWTIERARQGAAGMGRRPAVRPNWKKAIVTLREGDKIDIFEG